MIRVRLGPMLATLQEDSEGTPFCPVHVAIQDTNPGQTRSLTCGTPGKPRRHPRVPPWLRNTGLEPGPYIPILKLPLLWVSNRRLRKRKPHP